jgi:metal transporter CNNM
MPYFPLSHETLIWIGIVMCALQSGIFSGLNLAFFSVSRLRLEVEAVDGDARAAVVLAMRRDSNFLLATVLWGNVAVNVLLALLSNSVLAGLAAFLFSTVVITFFGEIIPQAYFSRHALRMAAALAPMMRLYQVLLYVVAKPTAMVLDWWLGKEGIEYFKERTLRQLIIRHVQSADSEIAALEGMGALNFLDIDDIKASEEGEPVDPRSVISLPVQSGRPLFPDIRRDPADPFLQRVQASGKKWVILTDPKGEPRLVLDADPFLRAVLFGDGGFNPYAYCHRPIMVKDPDLPLGEVISLLKVHSAAEADGVIDKDIILMWDFEKRVITGADLLGRLLKGIGQRNYD